MNSELCLFNPNSLSFGNKLALREIKPSADIMNNDVLRCGVTEHGFCLKRKVTYISESKSFLTTLVTILYRNVYIFKNTRYIFQTKYSELFVLVICEVKRNDLSLIRTSLQTQVFRIGNMMFSNFLVWWTHLQNL